MVNNNNNIEGHKLGDGAEHLGEKHDNAPQHPPQHQPQNVLNNPQVARQRPPPRQCPELGIWNNYVVHPDAVGTTGAIVLPPLPPGTMFSITSWLIQMLHSRGLFAGLPFEDPHVHLQNVAYVCQSCVGDLGLNMDVIGMCVFPLSLTGKASIWLSELPYNSITTWDELRIAFMEKYFPLSKKLKLTD